MVYPCCGYFRDRVVEADCAFVVHILRVPLPPDDHQDTHV